MKQVCLLCERTSPGGDLFCQETYCPAEMSPTILDHGDMLGDIEIVKSVIVQRHSILYEAMHQEKRVLLKVANPGQENKERLKRESEFLQSIQLKQEKNKFLPKLIPPYANTTIKQDPYGKSMLQGHLLYFSLFEFVEGEPLQDILKKNPQLWINHVGWIMIGLGSAVAFLNSHGLLHVGLSPESLLVRFEELAEVRAPRIKLFDLGFVADPKTTNKIWYPFFVPPAYTAPELLDARNANADYRSDVYGLGLVLYEMLVGEPAYTFRLRSDADVYRAVRRNQRIAMNRVEDVEKISNLAVKAVNHQPSTRQQDAVDVVKQLTEFFGPIPEKKENPWLNPRTLMIIALAIITVIVLIAIAISQGYG